ncbi:MAG: 4Fe-4S ferredoxin, partial [Candidatus Methanomethylicota archaeon]
MYPQVFAKPHRALAHANKVMEELLLDKLRVDEVFKGKNLVAVKVHIGERGNRTYVHPTYVAAAVNLLKSLGHEVFVTDTTTLYTGPRSNGVSCINVAFENGFTPETIRAPFIVADGILGEDGVEYLFEEANVKVRIARAIHEADALLVISHAKGHGMSGFGGALKNLAMGCVTKSTKKYQHDPYKPVLLRPELCNGCGECVKACLQEAVCLHDNLPVFRDEACIRCGGCVVKCPTKALSVA